MKKYDENGNSSGENILDVNNLEIQYVTDEEVIQAVNGVSFTLKERETIGLVGETGAGKTSIALGIMNLVPNPPGKVVNGKIFFAGEDILAKQEREMRSIRGNKIAMVFQDPMTSLNPVIPVGEQIREVIRLHKKISRVEAEEEAQKMLEKVGIPGERFIDYPHQLSGGMKQRVGIAIGLACNPMLLIADEPTTALDVTIQAQVLELMRDLKNEYGTSMILITHDLGVVAEVCDKAAIVYAGEIVEYGPLKDIYEDTRHPYSKGLFNSLPDIDVQSERLNVIQGLMPDPAHLPEGCKFHPRCPKNRPECSGAIPEIEVSPGHLVRCIFANER